MAKETYDHQAIEKAAQEKWESEATYHTDLTDTERVPYYLLSEFPYPSGDLHIGHWYAFSLPDIFARFKRMQGLNVLFPIGFDAFGLPAENAAIKNGLDPKEWTYKNMQRMRTQMRSMGASFDWSKEVVTCDPEYYRWTQWLFSKLYEHDLAERKEAAVKWCPKDQTVLANEQVIDGHCERCGTEVEEKRLTQWFLKITKFAKRLLEDLEPLPWREDIKEAQRAWIGESEGAKIFFRVRAVTNDDAGVIEVFTTRPDTIYGATYIVLAPEHPLVDTLIPLTTNGDIIEAYRTKTKRKTERERSENKEKTGVELKGVRAVNPANNVDVPIYIADYVLASYGTGAVMAVPAHDERDFEFAKKHDLPIVEVVQPRLIDTGNPHIEGKELITRNATISIVFDPQSQKYLCLKWKKQGWTTFVTGGVEEGEDTVASAIREIEEETGYTDIKLTRVLGGKTRSEFFAAHKDVNRVALNTVLLFELTGGTRQEVGDAELAQHEPVWLSAEEVLKAKLQHAEFNLIWQRVQSGMDAYTGNGLLVNSGEFDGKGNEEAMWDIAEKVGGERITNYRIRDWLVSRQRYWGCPIPVVYDPEGTPHLVPPEHLPWMLPTDVDFTPTGKSPLATSKELHERVERIFGEGWTPEYDTLDTFVDSSWYYLRYLSPHNDTEFSDPKLLKQWSPVSRYSGGSEHTTLHLLYSRFFHKALHDLALVPTAEPFEERFNRGIILGPDHQKMSKSKGNVVNPDEFVAKYGADAVRMYLAFIGPFNEPGQYPWSLEGVESMRRFLDRVYTVSQRVAEVQPSESLTRAVAKAIQKVEIDIERFKFNTAISALMILLKEFEILAEVPQSSYAQFLQLLAPFAPHLAEHISPEVHVSTWPKAPAVSQEENVTVIVQVNGKKRGELLVPLDSTQEDLLEKVLFLPSVETIVQGKEPARVIYVPGKILNLVIRE